MPRPVGRDQLKAPDKPGTDLKVVYFPSCINQSMGTSVRDPEKKPLVEVTVEVLENAGYTVIYPEGMKSLCCGTPWESKGLKAGYSNSRTCEIGLSRNIGIDYISVMFLVHQSIKQDS